MGTNFYLLTKSKAARDQWFKHSEYALTDFPDWGYEIHIAKTSYGWKPLFQAYDKIRSVQDLETCYKSGDFEIVDEYGDYYSWPMFKDRVLSFGKDGKTHEALKRYDPLDFFQDDRGFDFFSDFS